MEANELRIGNFVQGNPYIGKITVFNNDKCVIKHKSGIEKFLIKDLESILLNEKWLLDLGFEKHSTNPFWFRKKQLCVSLLGVVELVSWDMKIFKIDTKAEFVHTLQNLYFALTGEELTLIDL